MTGSNIRTVLVIFTVLLQGCSIARLDLRKEPTENGSRTFSSWKCPDNISVSYTGGTYTHTSGEKKYDKIKTDKIRNKYIQSTYYVLAEAGCKTPGEDKNSNDTALKIEIIEMQQLSATGGEYLTGLSFGLIPSWDTRYAELRFTMEEDKRTGVYVVDDKRFNHIIVFPVFWLSFFMQNEQQKYKDALQDFINKP